MRPAVTLRKTNLIQAACGIAIATVATVSSADTVELTNGDVLTGTVVQRDERGVILKHDVLGTIALDAQRIAKITPQAEQTEPKKTDEPKAQKSDANAKQREADKPDAPDTATIESTEQAALKAAAEDRNFWQRFREDWNSKITLGLNGSQGPTDRKDYRVRFNTKFEDGRDRVSFNTSWYYATNDGDKTQNQFEANLTKDWLKKDAPWFFFIKGQYKFDDNRSWENRTSAFGGGGYTLKKTEDVEVNTRLGFGGTYEYGAVDEFTPEALFGGSVVKWQLTERAAVAGEALYYPSLEDSTNFRIESSLELLYKLDMAEGLALKLGVENEYDSSTPAENTNNDLKYYGAIVLSF